MGNNSEKLSVLAANLDAVLKSDLREITATQFTRKQYVFPMSDAEFGQAFAATIAVFASPAPFANGGTVTNMLQSNKVSCPFLLSGVSVTLIPDTIRAAIDGMVTSWNTNNTPAWDRIDAATGRLIGTTDVVVNGAPTAKPAVMKWGSCSQDFAQAFAQAYNLRFLLGCKWEVFDEPLASMVSFDGQAGLTDGSGASLIDMAFAIKQANDRAVLAIGGTDVAKFFPRTIEQSPTLLNPDEFRAVLAPAPMAPENTGSVSWKNDGTGFFALDLPILLTPYTDIMMELHNNPGDLVYYPRMRQEATLAVDGITTYSTSITSSEISNDGAVATGPQGGAIALRKYGTLSIMTTLHGFNLESAAVSDYANLVASGGFASYAKLYSADPTMGPLVSQAMASRALEGTSGAKRLAGGPR